MMQRLNLPISGAYTVTSELHHDSRGYFREWFWGEESEFEIIQGNLSYSKKNVIRGLHVSTAAGGQAKWVTCVTGMINDVLLDLRPNSPTFLQKVVIEISAGTGIAVKIPPGVAHGFCSLEDGSVVTYLVSSKYDHESEVGIYPLDPEIGISWGVSNPILSHKDSKAMRLTEFMFKYEKNMESHFGN
jgi:dTDP-4-dehydrorhamnose 3,5-epimerase